MAELKRDGNYVPIAGGVSSLDGITVLPLQIDPVTGGVLVTNGGSSSGITSLNLQTGATQTFATGTSGTDFGISSASDIHTFNIPDASASARGLITTGAQTIAGLKTFSTTPSFPVTTGSLLYGLAGSLAQLPVGSTDYYLKSNGTTPVWSNSTPGTPYAETPAGLVDSSNVTYTLAHTPASSDNVIVFLDGVAQYNGIDYTVSGATITFVAAPTTGSSIFAYYFTSSGTSATGFDTRVIATNSASQTITIATTQIAFNTEILDNNNDFSGNVFTAPDSGVYHFELCANISVSSAGSTPTVKARKNGTEFCYFITDNASSFSGKIFSGVLVGGIVSMTLGDTLDFVSSATLSNSATIFNTESSLRLSIFRIA